MTSWIIVLIATLIKCFDYNIFC